jgi:hypothetical protein
VGSCPRVDTTARAALGWPSLSNLMARGGGAECGVCGAYKKGRECQGSAYHPSSPAYLPRAAPPSDDHGTSSWTADERPSVCIRATNVGLMEGHVARQRPPPLASGKALRKKHLVDLGRLVDGGRRSSALIPRHLTGRRHHGQGRRGPLPNPPPRHDICRVCRAYKKGCA